MAKRHNHKPEGHGHFLILCKYNKLVSLKTVSVLAGRVAISGPSGGGHRH